MEIPDSEYEERRTIFELCKWINSKLRALEPLPDFEKLYFERSEKNIKKLLEEAVPIAKLGLYFWGPWLDISVRCLAGNGAYDAELIFKSETIRIEVTCTETDETTMRRQALARDGVTYLMSPVRRERQQIISEPAPMPNLYEVWTHLVECAFERFQRKAEIEDDPQTAILVYVSSLQFLPLQYRMKLMEQTRMYLQTHNSTLYGVYYCYDQNQGVDGLRNTRRDLR